MNENSFKIHLTGQDLHPASIRIGKLTELLEAVEDLVYSTALVDHPTLTKDNLSISLVDIEPGSIGLCFAAQIPEVAIPSFIQVAEAIHSSRMDNLPYTVVEPMEKIVKFLHRNNAEADFIITNGGAKTLVTLTGDFTLPRQSTLTGITTIYGEVVRVGGVDPKVEIKTITGQTLFCSFARDLAPEIGAKLYKMAGFIGEAQWDLNSKLITQFKVNGITNYEATPIVETFHVLQNLVGKYFDDIEDVNAHIAGLRGET